MKSVLLLNLLILCIFSQNPFWDNIQTEIDQENKYRDQLNTESSNNSQLTENSYGDMVVVDGDENQHIQDIKKISNQASEIEQVFTQCIDEIPNDDYTQSKVDECIGVDSSLVVNDFDYIAKTIKATYIYKLGNFMIDFCYGPAGNDQNSSQACGLIDQDLKYAIWNEFDFAQLLEQNRIKYTFEFASLAPEIFDVVLEYLRKISGHFKEILDELYNHRDLTTLKVKNSIDEKTKIIMDIASQNPEQIKPTLYKHEITIHESLDSPKPPNFEEFPRPINQSSFNKLFQPEQDEDVNYLAEQYKNSVEDFDQFMQQGPIVDIPELAKKKKKKEKKRI